MPIRFFYAACVNDMVRESNEHQVCLVLRECDFRHVFETRRVGLGGGGNAAVRKSNKLKKVVE